MNECENLRVSNPVPVGSIIDNRMSVKTYGFKIATFMTRNALGERA